MGKNPGETCKCHTCKHLSGLYSPVPLYKSDIVIVATLYTQIVTCVPRGKLSKGSRIDIPSCSL